MLVVYCVYYCLSLIDLYGVTGVKLVNYVLSILIVIICLSTGYGFVPNVKVSRIT